MKRWVKSTIAVILVVALCVGGYALAAEIYETVQEAQTEELLEAAVGSVDVSPEEEAALEALDETVKIGVEVAGEEYLPPDRGQDLKKKRLEVNSAKVSERIKQIKDKDLLEEYINVSILYSVTDEEHEYLMKLMKRGYSFERVVEIYGFLQNTKDNLALLEEMYSVETADEFDMEYAYAVAKGREADELEVSDVFSYVDKGITTDEIIMAYEFSLHADKPIRALLDARADGRSWAEIAADCHIDASVDEETFAEARSLREINSNIAVARVTGNRIADVVNNEQVMEEFSHKLSEIDNACLAAGVTTAKGGVTQ